jgi:hypothetical protein
MDHWTSQREGKYLEWDKLINKKLLFGSEAVLPFRRLVHA